MYQQVVQHRVPGSAELPHWVPHLRFILLFPRSDSPVPSSWGALIPIQHLLPRQPLYAAYHVCPPRVLKRIPASHGLVDYLQRMFPRPTISLQIDGLFATRMSEKDL